MKKLLLLALPLLALCFVACDKYDDTGLRNELTSLKDRVSKLEELCKTLNTDISSLKTIVEALQNNDYITSYSALTDGSGYQITFAKSGAIIIKHGTNGKDGTNGTDGANAPVIGVALDNGIYYWTITTNGTTTWLTGDGDAKLRVTGENGTNGIDGGNGKSTYELAVEKGYSGTLEQWLISLNDTNGSNGSNGKSAYELAVELGYTGTLQEWLSSLAGTNGTNGITPILGVDASGYWTIDKGDGSGVVRLKDANGQDVKAVGTDGQNGTNGQDGTNGANGTSIFKSVTQDTNNVYFTLSDDSVITVPKGVGFSFSVDATGTQLFEYGETKTYTITQNNITNTSVSAPNGWRANIQGDNLTITSLAYNNYSADENGIVSILAVAESGQSIILKIDVNIESNYIRIPDNGFRACCIANFDADKDGKLSKNEIGTIIKLDCNSWSIYSLHGLEYFTALEQLNCSNNYLHSIDLSNNIALTTLNCSDNKLMALDVSRNTNLTSLTCSDNQLRILDISNNINLIGINSSNNQFLSTITVWNTFFPKRTVEVKGTSVTKDRNCQFLDTDGVRHYTPQDFYQIDGVNYIILDIDNYGINGTILSRTLYNSANWTTANSYWLGQSMRLPTVAELNQCWLMQNPLLRAFSDLYLTNYLDVTLNRSFWSSEIDPQNSGAHYYVRIGSSTSSYSSANSNSYYSFGVTTF